MKEGRNKLYSGAHGYHAIETNRRREVAGLVGEWANLQESRRDIEEGMQMGILDKLFSLDLKILQKIDTMSQLPQAEA